MIEFLISDYKFTPNVEISPMKSPFTIMSPNEMGRPRIFSSSSDDLTRQNSLTKALESNMEASDPLRQIQISSQAEMDFEEKPLKSPIKEDNPYLNMLSEPEEKKVEATPPAPI